MLARGSKSLPHFVALFLFVLIICLRLWTEKGLIFSDPVNSLSITSPAYSSNLTTAISNTHIEVHSLTTADKKYFHIKFGQHAAINANIIPHPVLNDTWIIVAQLRQITVINIGWNAQLVCDAVFKDNVLECVDPPLILPIAATASDNCNGELGVLRMNVGPHDARVFYGPKAPLALWGSNSQHVCFGQWMQDFRNLVNWAYVPGMLTDGFRLATEVQRPLPGPYTAIEKNWFIFWDQNEEMYAHYSVAPKRYFSKLYSNGSAGPDLAPLAATNDDKCIAKHMPVVGHALETIHQATNSLSVTLCRRSDPTCIPNDLNTFIFTIFHWRSFYKLHAVYEPYIMMFQRHAPFAMHAISQKPIWISGRGRVGEASTLRPRPDEDSEMVYVTSMSWKTQGQKYHGYIDDVLFLGFGIEDRVTGGIDFVVGDILMDMGLCE
ncbi:hypothetical protein BP6252_08231 [Coleophoma cylindrospora]|uniref:Uncharacterized protein n=1 Tax=Coleophoma cylindrospora TaxID=1849047 RepID=A0A3D8R5K4_9HELO|nr:hypothetical protein BP6252_08231 [Coleophoma cylindrospora]